MGVTGIKPPPETLLPSASRPPTPTQKRAVDLLRMTPGFVFDVNLVWKKYLPSKYVWAQKVVMLLYSTGRETIAKGCKCWSLTQTTSLTTSLSSLCIGKHFFGRWRPNEIICRVYVDIEWKQLIVITFVPYQNHHFKRLTTINGWRNFCMIVPELEGKATLRTLFLSLFLTLSLSLSLLSDTHTDTTDISDLLHFKRGFVWNDTT